MGIFNGYEKIGPGIPKDAPKKRGLSLFLDIYVNRFWKLISLNILYFVFCIPIVTIGPATAGFTKVLRNYSQQKNAFLFSDFFEAFRKNFKQAFIVGIIDIFIAFCIFLGVQFYPSLAKENYIFYVPFIIIMSLALTLVMMNFYIYLMLVSVDIKLSKIIKNAFILACVGIKKNFVTLLVVAAVIACNFFLIYFNLLFILLIPVFTLSLMGLIICFNSYPLIQKYVINPYYEANGEENPELKYSMPADPKEAIFVDKGGSEKPIKIPTRRKGKIIS